MKRWSMLLFLWPSIALAQQSASPPLDSQADVTKPEILPGSRCPIDEVQATAIRTCAQGSRPTLLKILVHADGFVSDISVIQSSGNDLVDLVAATCVSGWRYKPASHNGVPIDFSWTTQFDFRQSDPRCLKSAPTK